MISQFNGFEINPIHNADAWKICDFCIANAYRLKRYFPKTLEQNLNPTLSQLFVEEQLTKRENKASFLFTLKQSETRELVGLIYIKDLNWDKKQGEFAYCIGYTFEGQGLTSKAIRALSKYAFDDLQLETLQIITHKDNLPSVNLALNTNFKWKKTLANEFTPIGEAPLDMELYELDKK